MRTLLNNGRPRAIAMWDFSWLERRWAGAGYENWDEALDGLLERGYDAVRIDAYPHFVAADPKREWELIPIWHFLEWGAPCRTVVRVMPALLEFIGKCRDRGIGVGLSTWFREDRHNIRMHIADPLSHARVWIKTLRHIECAGLLDAIYYVDLCNEWPGPRWAPFFKNEGGPENDWNGCTDRSREWMVGALTEARSAYPQLSMSFSFASGPAIRGDFSFCDFFDPHIWLASQRGFYDKIGYRYQMDISGLEAVSLHAEKLYRANPEYWLDGLRAAIDLFANFGRTQNRPMITTECWALVDYRDWPMLDWGYVKEICEVGAHHAAATGCWAAIATSNFCGPQFVGMWRDIPWHCRLTDAIKSASRC